MTSPGSSLFVSAGEVSGDHYIASVASRLRERGFCGEIYGLCGAESRDRGVDCLWRNERLHLMGVSEVLASLPGILRLKSEMRGDIIKRRPAAILLADSPDFHMPLVRELRRDGYAGRIFYISPPSVWAWRSYRARELSKLYDECLPLFKFEHDYLRMSRCASLWVGHPLVEEFENFRPDKEGVLRGIKNAGTGCGELIALLPGSRRSEIEQLYPLLDDLYGDLEGEGFSPVFSVAPGLSPGAREFLVSRLASSGRRYYEGAGRDLMGVAVAIAGASGTATAEALLLERYMVVLYRVRPLSAFIGRRLLKHLFFAIPNLLAKELFYPELIQEKATSELAGRELMAWLNAPPPVRKEKESKMRELKKLMGRAGAYDFWTGRVLEALS